tara:strand:- start:99 stop:629 length:531 start_codon:yes stop_codon:yes gene_type:complete
LRGYTGREHELPIDAHGWYALIAPRRCLIHTAHNDGSEPTFAVERAYLEGRKVYTLLGHPDNLRVLYRTGQHGPVTEEQRRRNMEWFDLSFGRGAATVSANSGWVLRPVPTAVPPSASSSRSPIALSTRLMAASSIETYPLNSCPRVSGTASMRWVLPILTMLLKSLDLLAKALRK